MSGVVKMESDDPNENDYKLDQSWAPPAINSRNKHDTPKGTSDNSMLFFESEDNSSFYRPNSDQRFEVMVDPQ